MPFFEPPERILYVCAATGYGPANLVPIYALGRSLIAHFAILRGIRSPEEPNETELREAGRTGDRLRDFAFAELGLSHDRISVLDGDPDSFVDWERHARTVVEIASAENLNIVINLTGGPKQLAIGMEHHLRTLGGPFIRLFYSKYPAAPLFVFPSGNGLAEGSLEAPAERAPLELLVEAAGREVCSDNEETTGMRQIVEASPDAVRKIWPRFVTSRGVREEKWGQLVEIVRALNVAGNAHQDGALAVGQRERWRDVRALLDPENRLGSDRAGLVESPGGIRFFKGGWLEAILWQALTDALADRGEDADVRLSVSMRTPRSRETTDEIDVLVRLGDQLHLVEAKTSTTTRDNDANRLGDSIKKLAGLRKALGGTACHAWLVAPFLGLPEHALNEWEGRAADGGVHLLVGPGSLDRLVGEVTCL